jgi:hypothetical protein
VCFLSLSIPLPPPHSLRDGQITKEGLAVFCKVLAGNSYLQTLILGGNNLTDEGAQMLAAAKKVRKIERETRERQQRERQIEVEREEKIERREKEKQIRREGREREREEGEERVEREERETESEKRRGRGRERE